MKRPLVTALLSLAAATFSPAADKRGDTLFRPTPRESMREMATDRPDTTESAYSVDAGHFQVESTLFGFGRDGGVDSYAFAESNFKLGLTYSTDLQLVVPFYERETGGGDDAGGREGIGDLQVRLKWNLFGNDGGKTALALMPFVKVPTASHDLGNDKVEGGLIMPVAVALTDRFSFAAMAEVDIVHDEVRGGYETDFVATATVGAELTEKLGAFVEFASVATTRADASWEGYANADITFAVTDDLILDAGVNVGVNDAAQDFFTFVGVSWRH